MHYRFSHDTPVTFGKGPEKQEWLSSLSYEIDNKCLKYLSRERTLALRMTPKMNQNPEEGSWTYKLESSFRKNLVDPYASK